MRIKLCYDELCQFIKEGLERRGFTLDPEEEISINAFNESGDFIEGCEIEASAELAHDNKPSKKG